MGLCFCVYVFSHECTNGCGPVGRHPCTNMGLCFFVSRFLATNARMVVAVAVATQAGMYGAMLFVSRFLATNARMVVDVFVASKTHHSCIRG